MVNLIKFHPSERDHASQYVVSVLRDPNGVIYDLGLSYYPRVPNASLEEIQEAFPEYNFSREK